ncbi:MAG: hypothetical protein DRP78_00160 [Candidatus Omnitrophota bacterium]|nr:MAG: hypothetical protein DRP78_00160 [Candidatus Omnitrophota bacterium]
MQIPDNVIYFLEKQGVVIVSTMDEKGNIHCSVKGIVGIEKQGRVFVVDLYLHKTFENLKQNPRVSITAVDEHKFEGYTMQGKGKVVLSEKIKGSLALNWEKRTIERISRRVLKSVQSGVKSKSHFEAELPAVPAYLIEIDAEKIIDLSPPCMRESR